MKWTNFFPEFFSNFVHIWATVFKNGLSKLYGRQPLKNLKFRILNVFKIHFNFLKVSLSQILLGPFLNTLTHIYMATRKETFFLVTLFL